MDTKEQAAAVEGPSEQLAGTVTRVVFHNPETGWTVLRLKPAGGADDLTLVGAAPGIHEGAALTAEGVWRDDPAWGHQFVARAVRLSRPDDEASLVGFLASGVVKGLGKRLARRLVRSFGSDVLDVIERTPERLRTVRGLSEELCVRLRDSVGRGRHLRDLVAFLEQHGLGVGLAQRILDAYGAQAVTRVSRNPWALARDVRGVGFRTADELARRLGVDPAAPERLAAGLDHLLDEAAAAGDTAVPVHELSERLVRLTGCTQPLAERVLDRQVELGALHRVHDLSAGAELIQTVEHHRAETAIAKGLGRLGAGPLPWHVADTAAAGGRAATALGHPLAPSQAAALAAMLRTKVLVVTGGPGTGKTTLLRGLLAALPVAVLRVALAAPTGRAERRLADSTGHEAQTLHRLLEAEPGRGFRRGAARPLACDLVVVDEMSMVDTLLMAALVEALPDEAALLMVGDADQLPSVGPGQVLADLVAAGTVPVLRLTEIFRQAADSGIVANAHRIIRGEPPEFARDEAGDFFGVRVEGPEDAAAKLVELVAERIPERFGLDPVADVQVLCPVNRGPLGTRELNRRLQARLNPDPPAAHERGERRYAVGDKVMQVENDYAREVWNGDIGQIIAIREPVREVEVDLDGRRLVYGFDELEQLVPAYAITVHKAQGSEYPAVVLPLARQHGRMLQRRLLYTAVSRAKRLVVLLAEPAALERAVAGRMDRPRLTLLAQRLRQVETSR